MHEETRKSSAFDLIKEVIWSFLFMLVSYIYFIALLLAISFVFNSIIDLSLIAILLISFFLTLALLILRSIKRIKTH